MNVAFWTTITMYTIDNLRHFIAVLENDGVLRAAEKLFISPSSITRSIQQLEETLGSPLFDRIGRKIKINRSGKKFYDKAKRVVGDFDGLFNELNLSPLLIGHYRIGASHFLCEYFVPKFITHLVKKHPRATFEITSFDSQVLLGKIKKGEVDFGFSFSPRSSDILISDTFRKGNMYLCTRKNHPLVGIKAEEVMEKIAQYPAIIHRPSDSVERCDDHPMFRKHKIVPQIQIYWDSDGFAVESLKQSDSWSMLPDIVIDSSVQIKKLNHPSDWKAPYEIALIWHKSHDPELRSIVMGELKNQKLF